MTGLVIFVVGLGCGLVGLWVGRWLAPRSAGGHDAVRATEARCAEAAARLTGARADELAQLRA